jgi:hypothetical protein
LSDDYWFRQKAFGYGIGLPLNWKGWMYFAVLFAGVFGARYLTQHFVPRHDWGLAAIAVLGFFIVPMIWLAWCKTEGGWRWRG